MFAFKLLIPSTKSTTIFFSRTKEKHTYYKLEHIKITYINKIGKIKRAIVGLHCEMEITVTSQASSVPKRRGKQDCVHPTLRRPPQWQDSSALDYHKLKG